MSPISLPLAAQARAGRGSPVAGVSTRASAPKKNDGAHIAEAARQFESLLISQLLKSTQEAGGAGWLGTGEDQAGAQALELAQEQFAQTLAKQGGLGLARLVVSGLRQAAARSSEPGAAHSEAKAGVPSAESR
jgi:Rod binding domain-containing protein